jgi:hypothetical protein
VPLGGRLPERELTNEETVENDKLGFDRVEMTAELIAFKTDHATSETPEPA